jgi:hypothetical protein
MSTPNLAIPHIAASQNQKEVTANDAFDRLDRALCGITVKPLTGLTSPHALTTAEALQAAVLQLAPTHPGGTFEVVVPTNRKLYAVRNLSGGTVTVRTPSGSGVAVPHNLTKLLYANGTDVVDLSPAPPGAVASLDDLTDVDTSTSPPATGDGLRWTGSLWVPATRGLDVGVFVPDRPAAGALVFKLVAVRAFSLPAGLTGSRGHASTAATAQSDFEVRHNGTAVGTVRFAAGSSTASFIMASPLALAEADRLELVAPTPQDATLADLTILLKGRLA